jgi:hypothetical protein
MVRFIRLAISFAKYTLWDALGALSFPLGLLQFVPIEMEIEMQRFATVIRTAFVRNQMCLRVPVKKEAGV